MHTAPQDGGKFANIATKNAARFRVRTKKFNLALLGSHIAVVVAIIGIIGVGYKAPVEASSLEQTNRALTALDQAAPSIDQIAAAEVATAVAQVADLSVETNVQSLSISLAGKTELAQTDNTFLTKPQIVQNDSGRKGVFTYTTKQGDTVQSLAAQLGLSEDSIRWANSLTSDALPAGKQLQLPGTTGIIYTVKPGDNAARLAEKYRADKDRIVTYNDAELTGLVAGQKIIIPDGILPETERPGYRPAYNGGGWGDVTYLANRANVHAGNAYAYGYCTYYAYNRRAELGRTIGSYWGNAATWASFARAAGFRVDKTPAPGAIFQTGGGWGGMGHVGIVEKVNPDGSFVTSEMNYGRWNTIASRTIPASQVGQYNYIH